MTSFTLDTSAADALLTNVASIFTPAAADDILLTAGRAVGVVAEGLVSPYPPASGNALPLWYPRVRQFSDGTSETYLSKFKSLKQQRKVMMLVKFGKVPYRRSGQLGRSILSAARVSGTGLVIVAVGSNLAYAPYVIDKIMQSHYHLGTWTPIQDDIEKGLTQLTDVAVNSIVKQVNQRINKK